MDIQSVEKDFRIYLNDSRKISHSMAEDYVRHLKSDILKWVNNDYVNKAKKVTSIFSILDYPELLYLIKKLNQYQPFRDDNKRRNGILLDALTSYSDFVKYLSPDPTSIEVKRDIILFIEKQIYENVELESIIDFTYEKDECKFKNKYLDSEEYSRKILEKIKQGIAVVKDNGWTITEEMNSDLKKAEKIIDKIENINFFKKEFLAFIKRYINIEKVIYRRSHDLIVLGNFGNKPFADKVKNTPAPLVNDKKLVVEFDRQTFYVTDKETYLTVIKYMFEHHMDRFEHEMLGELHLIKMKAENGNKNYQWVAPLTYYDISSVGDKISKMSNSLMNFARAFKIVIAIHKYIGDKCDFCSTSYLKVEFPKGEVIYRPSIKDTFYLAIEKIGPYFVEKLDIIAWEDRPLVFKTDVGVPYKLRKMSNGSYLMIDLPTDAQKKVLDEISKRCYLNLRVSIIK